MEHEVTGGFHTGGVIKTEGITWVFGPSTTGTGEYVVPDILINPVDVKSFEEALRDREIPIDRNGDNYDMFVRGGKSDRQRFEEYCDCGGLPGHVRNGIRCRRPI